MSRTPARPSGGGQSEDGESRCRLGLGADAGDVGGGPTRCGRHHCVLVGDEGEVLTGAGVRKFLTEIVHRPPWQSEVQRALHVCPRPEWQGTPPFDRQARARGRYFTAHRAGCAPRSSQRHEQRLTGQRQRQFPGSESAHLLQTRPISVILRQRGPPRCHGASPSWLNKRQQWHSDTPAQRVHGLSLLTLRQGWRWPSAAQTRPASGSRQRKNIAPCFPTPETKHCRKVRCAAATGQSGAGTG